mmetsp:Transcript_65854/g.148616  ORF Transcript_65854/g.148616 Transcript_65854/m.148616 type:complete len:228 (-) Transcript_65854:532-1215(-)
MHSAASMECILTGCLPSLLRCLRLRRRAFSWGCVLCWGGLPLCLLLDRGWNSRVHQEVLEGLQRPGLQCLQAGLRSLEAGCNLLHLGSELLHGLGRGLVRGLCLLLFGLGSSQRRLAGLLGIHRLRQLRAERLHLVIPFLPGGLGVLDRADEGVPALAELCLRLLQHHGVKGAAVSRGLGQNVGERRDQRSVEAEPRHQAGELVGLLASFGRLCGALLQGSEHVGDG